MDLRKMIADLQLEKARIERAIEELEKLGGESMFNPSRRGRKSMPEEERRQVSERMKRYWSRRRKQESA